MVVPSHFCSVEMGVRRGGGGKSIGVRSPLPWKNQETYFFTRPIIWGAMGARRNFRRGGKPKKAPHKSKKAPT